MKSTISINPNNALNNNPLSTNMLDIYFSKTVYKVNLILLK